MKRWSIFIIICFVSLAFGQSQNGSFSTKRMISIRPFYQPWTIENAVGASRDFSQISTAVSLYLPASRRISFSARAAGAQSGGDLNSLDGFTDVQLSANYYLISQNTIFTLNVNLPTGKTRLTEPELLTSSIISNSVFRLRSPASGQGFNISPGVIWLKNINEYLTIGLGMSYQFKGTYQPIVNFGILDPGDELLTTGGIDIRLNASTSLSGDVILTTYGTDKLDQSPIFSAGNKALVAIQLRKYFRFHELQLLAHFRTQEKNEFSLTNEKNQITPNHIHLSAGYRFPLQKFFWLNVVVESRFYGKAASELSDGAVWGIGIFPELRLSSTLHMPFHLKYLSGGFAGGMEITGMEIGTGLVFYY